MGFVWLQPQPPLPALQEHLVGQVDGRVDPTEGSPGTMWPTVFFVLIFFLGPSVALHKAAPPEVVGHSKSVAVERESDNIYLFAGLYTMVPINQNHLRKKLNIVTFLCITPRPCLPDW